MHISEVFVVETGGTKVDRAYAIYFLSVDDFASSVPLYLVLVSYHSSKSRLHALQYTTCQDSTVLAARSGQTSMEENQIE